MTDVQKEDVKWDEQIIAESAEDNILMQEAMDPQKLSASESMKDGATEPSIDESPKPAPRYGHAACKYQGLLTSQVYTFMKE